MTDREWLAGLEWFGIKLGLATIGEIASSLGHPERAYPVIHVAGTNGKGSVAAMVARALQASGRRTGRYTSPHLIQLEERFAIDSEMVSRAEFDRALAAVRRMVDQRGQHHPELPPPTYFEVTTAAAFEIFRAARVEVAVVEVGLGGRFDATNVVSPIVTVITSVDLDHEVHLGTTLEAIAGEKAGIIKPGVPVVVGPLDEGAFSVVSKAASAGRAPMIPFEQACRVGERALGDGRREVVIRTEEATYGPVTLALRGRHQVTNAAVAVLTLEAARRAGLAVTPDDVVTGLRDTRWPARLDLVSVGDRSVLVDGAHNPAGARALAEYLREVSPDGLPIVFGLMADKAAEPMLSALAPLAVPLVVTRAPGRRAADPDALAEIAGRLVPTPSLIVEPDIGRALAAAWRHQPTIVVAGSLYLAGDVLARIARRNV